MVAGNPTSTLEKPKNYLEFSELGALRDELTKQTEDAEKRSVLEKTIDEALKSGEKNGIIEFTREEWETLTKTERFASVGAVKELLKQKIIQRREVTEEAKVEKQGLIAKIGDKVEKEKDKLVDAGKQKIEDVKTNIEQKIKESLSPLEKLKFGWDAMMFGIKIAFYGMFAKIGFGWAKNGLEALKKEKSDKLQNWAKEKGLIVPEVTGTGTEPKKEETPETLSENTHAPLAILSTLVGVGVLGKILPGKFGTALALSRSPKLAGISTALTVAKSTGKIAAIPFEAMKFVGKCGMLGLLGFAGYKLYKHLESNPADMAEAGSKPDKSWWTKMIEKVWSREPATQESEREKKYLLSYVSGEMEIDTVTEDSQPEGMESMGDKIEKAQEVASEPIIELADKLREFPNAMAVLGVTIGAKIGVRNILSFTKMSAEIAINLAKTAFFGMPITAVLALLGYLGWKKFASESVPKDPKEFENFIVDHAEEIDQYCIEEGLKGADGKAVIAPDKLRAMAGYISAPEKIATGMRNALGTFGSLILNVTKNTIGESPEKIEREKNLLGIHTMHRRLEDERKDDPSYTLLLSELEKLKNKVGNIDPETDTINLKSVTKEDIETLKKASAGTDILIESHHGYILWSHAEKQGNDVTYLSVPQRFCIDPEITSTSKRHDLSKEFQIDTEVTTGNYLGGLGESLLNDTQSLIYGLTVAIEGDKKDEAETIMQILFDRGCNIVSFGASVFIEGAEQGLIELPINTVRMLLGFAGAKDWGITIQEFGAQYANGLIPMCIFSKVMGGLSPLAHHEDILRRITNRIPVLGKPLEIVVRSAIKPITASYDVLRYAGRRITNPRKILTDLNRRVRYVYTSLINAIPGSSATNSLQIVEGIKARYLIDHMDTWRTSGRFVGHNKEILKESLEHLLGHNKLPTPSGPLSVDDILSRVEGKKNIKEIVDALDDHIKGVRLEFFKNSPKIKAMVQAIMKIPGATAERIDRAVRYAMAMNAHSRQLWRNVAKLSPGASGAFMAYMLYDLTESKDPGKTFIEHTSGFVAFIAGQKATKETVGKLFKNPLLKETIGLLGGVAASIFGVQIVNPEAIEKKIGEWMNTGEFTHAVFNEASSLEYVAGAKILAKSALGKTVGLASAAGLEKLGASLSKKFGGKVIGKCLEILGKKIGQKVAGKAAGYFIPGVNVILGAWTAYDVYTIGNMVIRTQKMSAMNEEQQKKKIKNIDIDQTGEKNIADHVTMTTGGKIDYWSLSQEEKNTMIEEHINAIAECNVTIEREDGSSEQFWYVGGAPRMAKIVTKEETLELTAEDLETAENWTPPTEFRPEKIDYTLPEESLKIYYAIQVQILKASTQWQKPNAEVLSGGEIIISRETFEHDKIHCKRQPDNSWKISSEKHGDLPGSYSFHGAVAMANLSLYSMEWLKKTAKDDGAWQSEDGTLEPFSVDNDSLDYAKDDWRDQEFLEKWFTFYRDNLKIRPDTMKNTLNNYFGKIAKELDLIGD